jgi:hypothetical protein
MNNTSFELDWYNKRYKVSDIQFSADGSVRRVKVFQDGDSRDEMSKWLYPNGKDIVLIERGNF